MHALTITYGQNHNGDRRTIVNYMLNGRPACTNLPGHVSEHGVQASIQWFRNNDINRH